MREMIIPNDARPLAITRLAGLNHAVSVFSRLHGRPRPHASAAVGGGVTDVAGSYSPRRMARIRMASSSLATR